MNKMTYNGNWRMPNLMEKEYYNHIIGKSELKSKLGRFGGGEQIYGRPLDVVRIDVLMIANLNRHDIDKPPNNIIIVRSYEYNITLDKDKFMSDLFKFSLTHNIVEVNPNNTRIYLAKSKNGKTNITKEVMELLVGKLVPQDEDQGLLKSKQV